MSNEIVQIGQRLKGLREAFEMSVEDFAASCGISVALYREYEHGTKDMTISVLKTISEKYNIDTSVLMFDDEPRMSSYFLTRKGKGLAIKRVETYNYQTLAGGFNNRKAEVFEVTMEPKIAEQPLHLSSHHGQEFNMVLEGSMMIQIDGKELILNEGDSLYYDSNKLHGMKPINGKAVRFLSVVL